LIPFFRNFNIEYLLTYRHIIFYRKLIDKKNQQVEIFDLGNHILIVGTVLLVILVSLNVE